MKTLTLCAAVVLAASQATLAESAGEFKLTVLTDEVPNARQMAQSPSGTLYVGTRRAGKLYAVVSGEDGSEPEVVTFASGLEMPSGIAILDGDLYVAALDRVLRYRDIDESFREDPEPEVVTDALPGERHHGWKYLAVGPDSHLYVNVGAPCNICLSDDPRFASILRLDPQTGEADIYAAGVRPVGMAWHPERRNLVLRQWPRLAGTTPAGGNQGPRALHYLIPSAGADTSTGIRAGHDSATTWARCSHPGPRGALRHRFSPAVLSVRVAACAVHRRARSWNRSSKVATRQAAAFMRRAVLCAIHGRGLSDDRPRAANDVLVSGRIAARLRRLGVASTGQLTWSDGRKRPGARWRLADFRFAKNREADANVATVKRFSARGSWDRSGQPNIATCALCVRHLGR